MSKTTTVEINGTQYSGIVSDMDGFFAAGLLMPDFEEILAKQKGLSEAFQRFAAEQQAMSAIADGDELVNKITQMWGERALLRLLSNRDIRLSFTQRVREIFKDMPRDLINYERWTEAGRLYEEGTIRIDMEQIMTLVGGMMEVIKETPVEEPKLTPVRPKVSQKVSTDDVDGQVAKLEAQINELKNLGGTAGKGFG